MSLEITPKYLKFFMPHFKTPLDNALWILDRALDKVWQNPGSLDKNAYYLLRNASYHLQGEHSLCTKREEG